MGLYVNSEDLAKHILANVVRYAPNSHIGTGKVQLDTLFRSLIRTARELNYIYSSEAGNYLDKYELVRTVTYVVNNDIEIARLSKSDQMTDLNLDFKKHAISSKVYKRGQVLYKVSGNPVTNTQAAVAIDLKVVIAETVKMISAV